MRRDKIHLKRLAARLISRATFTWFYALMLTTALTLALSPQKAGAQAAISKEYQIKAVFLFNFAQFVQWPETNFPDAGAPFRIGVLGDDPFNTFLDETVRGENIKGHPLTIQRYHNVDDARGCQILFVSRSESKQMEEILARLKGRNILTVGEVEGFLKAGGAIRFVTEQNKIHLRVSLEAARNANLAISSKILRLSEIVEPGKD
jgi:hypothetical protein